MPEPCVITVILNTNRRDDTLACLESLGKGSYSNHHVIVLDNASTDGSAESIRSLYPDVQVIGLEKNLGYAGNNNVGIRAAIEQGADWVFVLNEDTIVDSKCIAWMIRTVEKFPQAGILGPLVYHHDEPEYIQSAGGILDAHWAPIHLGKDQIDEGQFTEPKKVDWISGCVILVKRDVIQQVGGLDERFFYYFEETDWCLRASERGWDLIHVPEAKIWHKGVQRNYHPGPRVTYYCTRNWFMLLSKHKAPLQVWAYVWIITIKTLLSWSFRSKWRSMHEHRDAMWKGTLDFLRHRWGPMAS
jgi:GT2 family glycosyltransferase